MGEETVNWTPGGEGVCSVDSEKYSVVSMPALPTASIVRCWS